jgi:gluconate 2-dehydrogenase gamma chain
VNRRDFLRGTSLAALGAAVRGVGAQEQGQGQSKGQVLTAHQWRTLALVQDHLLPSEPGAPGSGDINATAYLDGVLADPDLGAETKALILNGVEWLDDLAREGAGYPFADLEPGPREDLLRALAERPTGDRWLSTLIGYVLETLLGDPLYGGNPGGIGWAWLEHDPGRPRPTPANIYGRLGRA